MKYKKLDDLYVLLVFNGNEEIVVDDLVFLEPEAANLHFRSVMKNQEEHIGICGVPISEFRVATLDDFITDLYDAQGP